MQNLFQHLTTQLKGMKRMVDAETGAILFRHPTLRASTGLRPSIFDGWKRRCVWSKLFAPLVVKRS
jgi:hypothetical protein